MKISKYLGLNKIQAELDFVDIDIYEDIPLFLDPWAIRQGGDDFSIECHNIIYNYFSQLVKVIREGDKKIALQMLSQLQEPSETHLGLSNKSFSGSGIGKGKAQVLYNALAESEAVKTGFLTDLEDTALLIEGISNDNISDIVTNLIKLQLIRYTQRQCNFYGISMRKLPTGYCWDNKFGWKTQYDDMLVIEDKKIILVPKIFVRKDLSINFQDYYRKEVIEYEQMYHLNNNTSLCETLKGGALRKPYKKTLIEKHKEHEGGLKDYVYNFTKSNPNILKEYKDKVFKESRSQTDEINQTSGLNNRIDYLMELLPKISPGKKDAYIYEDIIYNILEILFSYALFDPQKQYKINKGLKIIDITYKNSANCGFFLDITKSNISCREIYFECKNYSEDLSNVEIDQLNGRFIEKISEIGFIVCRNNKNSQKLFEKCKFFTRQNHYIIILEDKDLITLLKLKKEGKGEKIESFLNEKLNKLLKD